MHSLSSCLFSIRNRVVDRRTASMRALWPAALLPGSARAPISPYPVAHPALTDKVLQLHSVLPGCFAVVHDNPPCPMFVGSLIVADDQVEREGDLFSLSHGWLLCLLSSFAAQLTGALRLRWTAGNWPFSWLHCSVSSISDSPEQKSS